VFFRNGCSADPGIKSDNDEKLYFEDKYGKSDIEKSSNKDFAVWVEKIIPQEVKICF